VSKELLKTYSKVDLKTGEVVETKDALKENKDIIEKTLETAITLESSADVVERALKETKKIGAMVEQVLNEGAHYGIVPGTTTKTLFQAGADILCRSYGIEVAYDLVDKTIELSDNLIDYTFKAIAFFRGKKIGEALASANSLEQKFKSHF